ncbi:MAG: hypothetical protein JSR39_00185 [Verrucomicrobia bacterium]|nr:hypothetical protein [Verrucomicrobiota bacterium]
MRTLDLSISLAAMLSVSAAHAEEKLVEASYFDFAMSFGTNIWPYIDWSVTPPVIDESKMDAYLSSLFSQMKGAGQTTIYLAFAQLDNIDVYATGNFEASGIDVQYDVIAQLLNQFQKSDVQISGYDNFLTYLTAQAHANGMSVAVAFGGANATDKAFKILQQPGQTYAGAAQELASVAKSYSIDRLDFDIEDPTALSSQPLDCNGDSVVSFFQDLHGLLLKVGKTMTLTSMLSLADWPNGALKPLFYDSSGNRIFSQLFDGLNLMAYSDTQYWLDPNSISWGIEQWIDIIGKQNTGLAHIGFDDGVPYAQSSANGGSYPYVVQPGSPDGQAAAQIYQQLQHQLSTDGYDLLLGSPFFWPAASVYPHGESRYSMQNETSNFVSEPMQDFFNANENLEFPREKDKN